MKVGTTNTTVQISVPPSKCPLTHLWRLKPSLIYSWSDLIDVFYPSHFHQISFYVDTFNRTVILEVLSLTLHIMVQLNWFLLCIFYTSKLNMVFKDLPFVILGQYGIIPEGSLILYCLMSGRKPWWFLNWCQRYKVMFPCRTHNYLVLTRSIKDLSLNSLCWENIFFIQNRPRINITANDLSGVQE